MAVKKIIFSLFIALHVLHAQNDIDFNINDEDFEISSTIDLTNFMSYYSDTSYLVHLNYLNTNTDSMSSIGVSGKNFFQDMQNISLSIGIKSVFLSDFIALPLTVNIGYLLPLIEEIPDTTLHFSFAYAPSMMLFSEAENYTEIRSELSMEIISSIHIYTGYRHVTTDYIGYNKIFNKSPYFGVKINF